MGPFLPPSKRLMRESASKGNLGFKISDLVGNSGSNH